MTAQKLPDSFVDYLGLTVHGSACMQALDCQQSAGLLNTSLLLLMILPNGLVPKPS